MVLFSLPAFGASLSYFLPIHPYLLSGT